MTDLIRKRLEEYRDAAWQVDHRRAMEVYDLDDWLAYGLAILGAIRRIDEQYQQRVQTGRTPMTRDVVEHIRGLYEIWCAPADHLLNTIGEFEREGFGVDNAAAFRAACRDPHVIGFDPNSIRAAVSERDAGRAGRPLGEAMDAVRRRAQG